MLIIRKHKGLGDTVAAVTAATGIKTLVESITKDCGCKERQASLNNPDLLINKLLYGTKQDIEVLRDSSGRSRAQEGESTEN
jgi:hypothetical protein